MQKTQEIQIQSLGREDSPGKRMATHSNILVWAIPRTEEPGGLQSIRSQRVEHNLAHMHHLSRFHIYVFIYDMFFSFWLTSYVEFRKYGTDEPICRAGIDADIENGPMDPGGWEGEGETRWRSITDIPTRACVKYTDSWKQLHSTESSNPCSVMT